jgi:hypothetical protein
MSEENAFNVTIDNRLLVVVYKAEEYIPGTMYDKRGDPGNPPEGGGIEEVRVFLVTGEGQEEITGVLDEIKGLNYFYEKAKEHYDYA